MPNAPTHRRRTLRIAGIAALLLVLAAIGAWLFVQRELSAVAHRLVGPRGSIESLHMSITGLRLHGLRIRGNRGDDHDHDHDQDHDGDADGAAPWPTDDELRIDDLLLVPDMGSFVGRGTRRIRRIDVHGATLVLLRDRRGKVHVLPSLMRPKQATPERAERATVIDLLQLDEVTLDYYDRHVRQPAHHLRIEHVGGRIGPQALPALTLPMEVDLRGVGGGVRHDGRIALSGHLTPSTRDADLKLDLAGIDLVALQPYLLKVNEGGVTKGDLDLQLHAKVDAGRLSAPGHMALRGLVLADAHEGLLSTFAGLPRKAVLAAMTRNGRIALDFTLQGRLGDPKFELDDDLATRVAGGMANALGVTVGGLVDGVGGLIDSALGH